MARVILIPYTRKYSFLRALRAAFTGPGEACLISFLVFHFYFFVGGKGMSRCALCSSFQEPQEQAAGCCHKLRTFL